MLAALQNIKAKAEWQMSRVILALAGLVLLSIGGGFLVAAIWMILAAEFSALIATLLCAALFVGAGLIVLTIRSLRTEPPALSNVARKSAPSARADRRAGDYPALIEAIVFGVSVYQRLRNERRRR